jgi:hypothetical protein
MNYICSILNQISDEVPKYPRKYGPHGGKIS